MIGDAKADAVREVVTTLDIDPGCCSAYGDHSSDLAMLCVVGRPTVVGRDPVLLAAARREGWPVLPATTTPCGVLTAA
jgi:phosphoserine phosphatase